MPSAFLVTTVSVTWLNKHGNPLVNSVATTTQKSEQTCNVVWQVKASDRKSSPELVLKSSRLPQTSCL